MELTPTTTSRGSRLKQSFLAVYCVVAAILLASTVVMPYRLSAIEGDAPSPAVVSPAPDETSKTPTNSHSKTSSSSKSTSNTSSSASSTFTNDNPSFASTPSWGINFADQPNGALKSGLLHYDTGNVGYGSDQLEDYTDSTANARVENGVLLIQALEQSENGSPYTSARLTTEGIKSFAYGKLDVVAEEPSGNGTWPSIWLISANQPYAASPTVDGQSSYFNSGEIDIAESIGAQSDKIYSVLQAARSNYFMPNEHYNAVSVPNDTTAFHDYGIEWTPTTISFTIDGNVTYTLNKDASWDYTTWPYTAQNPFNLVINLAMGGWGGAVDNAALPATMQVKSITYWPYVGN
jgi:beta-glucanase (GH16 family)